jgi:hypothetical protein
MPRSSNESFWINSTSGDDSNGAGMSHAVGIKNAFGENSLELSLNRVAVVGLET